MSHAIDDALEQGREAARRRAWSEAYELLARADEQQPLSPADLEHLAYAAVWSNRVSEGIAVLERLHRHAREAGDVPEAARYALELGMWNSVRGKPSVAHGWHRRAATLLENEPESLVHGYLALQRAQLALFARDNEAAIAEATRAEEIGARYRDPSLEAEARMRRGVATVRRGDVDEGLGLLDESTAAAIAGDLEPLAATTIYCCTIDVCRDLADFGRAAEWTETAMGWCERHSIPGFPGECRVNRAEILRRRGAWEDAAREAETAVADLQAFPYLLSAAFHEIGEIRLRLGDFAGADDAFGRARELGRDPQPGLALLRLAEGKVEAASRSLERTLAEERDPLRRARLVPAQVEIALAAGDVPAARRSADELDRIVDDYKTGICRTEALQASAATARGTVQLAEGDSAGAISSLRRAFRLWQDVDAPYDGARTRVLLARAYRKDGDEDGAVAELEAAKSAFERLGATRDARRAAELLGAVETTRAFVFTDIVGSTQAAEAMGDEKWKKVLKLHDEMVASLIGKHGGSVVKHTGDGFFAAFESADSALDAAVAIQRSLSEYPGYTPDVRIGVHAAGSYEARDGDYGGQGVNVAARIAALAEACEIVASRETVEGGEGRHRVSQPRAEELRGVSEPVEVVSVEWR